MGRKILFSVVGNNDPINNKGIEGPMLHICRHEKPNIVYLYLTKDMLERENLDHRYSEFIKKLGKELDHTFEIIPITKSEISNPSLYNKMYEDLNNVFEKLQFEKDDQLLINMSSGTPAITQSLQVLYALGKISATCTFIQVSYKPLSVENKKINIDELWEKYQEQKKENKDKRIKPYNDLNLSFLVQEKAIKEHIKSYNYAAAYTTACMLRDRASSYIKYIKAADDRFFLKYEKSLQVLKDASNIDEIFPVQDENFIKFFEYIMYLKIKIEKKEFTDFYRGISPIIFELFKVILSNQNIDIDKLTDGKYWDENKIDDYDVTLSADKIKIKDSLKKIPNFNFNSKSKKSFSFVSSQHLNQIISDNVADDEIIKSSGLLRVIEFQIRNPVAHQISIIDKDWIIVDKKTIYINDILQLLIDLFGFAYQKTDERAWDAYKAMNNFIIEKIGLS